MSLRSMVHFVALLVLVLFTNPCAVDSARLVTITTAQGHEASTAHTHIVAHGPAAIAYSQRQLLLTNLTSDCTTCAELSAQLHQLAGQKWHVRCHLAIIGHDMGLPLDGASQQVDDMTVSNIVTCAELCANHSCGRGTEPDCCQGFTFVINKTWKDMGCFLKTGISWGALASTQTSAPGTRNARGVACVNLVSALHEGATGCDADPVCRATKRSSQNAFTISIISLMVAAFAALSSSTMRDVFSGCCNRCSSSSRRAGVESPRQTGGTDAATADSKHSSCCHRSGDASMTGSASRCGSVTPADVADAIMAKPEVRVVLSLMEALAHKAAASAGPAGGVKANGVAQVDVEAGADDGTA